MNFDKLKGTIVAVALGDAHEFRHNKAEYTGKLEHNVVLFNRFQGESVYPVGSITDDTQMTMIILNHIVNNKGYYPEKIVLEYEKWATTAKMMGKNTRELFKGVTTHKGYTSRYNKKFIDTSINEWTQSNGSLMRCSPFVIFNDYNALQTDVKLTNPHPINIESGFIYMFVMRNLLINDKLPDIDELFKYTNQPAIKDMIMDVKTRMARPISDKSVKGWVVTALYCALYSIYHIPTFKEAAEYFIKQKGDTDTNCAILGGLYGARDGFNKLYLENVYNIDLILKTNKELANLDYLIGLAVTV